MKSRERENAEWQFCAGISMVLLAALIFISGGAVFLTGYGVFSGLLAVVGAINIYRGYIYM